MKIEEYRAICSPDKIAVTKHARIRLEERGIHMDDIIRVINNGEIIKEYADDKPLSSCLILGKSMDDNPLHLVISKDEEFIYLITAYFPDIRQWENDFKTRKEH